MSKLSIYETSWINLVFENRNKEYGAYQLRQDCVKSSLKALFTGIVLVAILVFLTQVKGFIPTNSIPETTIPLPIDAIIQVTSINLPQSQESTPLEVPNATPEVPITNEILSNPIIVSSAIDFPEIATNNEISVVSTGAINGHGLATGNPHSNSTSGTVSSPITVDSNELVSTSSLDKLPEIPGGIAKFYSYVGSNFEKPEIEDSEAIRVFVNFIIEKDGSMTSIQVKSDPGHGIGKEAIRVLQSLKTKWIPGMVNSKAVRTAYSLPITIRLE